MTRSNVKVCVIGAGVCGLSTAIALAREGFQVRVIASQTNKSITSSAAAAFWYPFWTGEKPDHSWYKPEWAWDTFLHLESFLNESASGVTEANLVEYFPQTMTDAEIDEVIEFMWWRHIPRLEFEQIKPDSSLSRRNSLPDWRFNRGITFKTLVINMAHYLPYLTQMAKDNDIPPIEERFLVPDDLPNLVDNYDFVVNCSGLGSRELVPDDDVRPVEGVVVRLPPHPDIQKVVLVHTGRIFSNWPLYIVPRGGPEKDIIVGGTLGKGRKGLPRHLSWPVTDPSEDMVREDAKSILNGCKTLEPKISDSEPLNVTVGYRPSRGPAPVLSESDSQLGNPARSGVRLETEWGGFSRGRLIHNYGHGGGGVTLCWGCAIRVTHWVKGLAAGLSPE